MNLTAKDISEIIKNCKDSGVSEITFGKGTFRIVFASKPIEQNSPPQQPSSGEKSEFKDKNEVVFSDHPVKPEMEHEQTLVDELMISDPEKFEELVASGELINNGSEEKNDRGSQ